jgi:cold shock CspA family protein
MVHRYQYGTLTRMMPDRNFFFIRNDESGLDIFTHISAFAGKVALPKGTRVKFRLVPNSRKPGLMMAADVEPIVPVSSVVSR